jgi:hypothetical protein
MNLEGNHLITVIQFMAHVKIYVVLLISSPSKEKEGIDCFI